MLDDLLQREEIAGYVPSDGRRAEAATFPPALPVDAEGGEVGGALAIADHPCVAGGGCGRVDAQLAAEQVVDERHRIAATTDSRLPVVELGAGREDRDRHAGSSCHREQVVVDEALVQGVGRAGAPLALEQGGQGRLSLYHGAHWSDGAGCPAATAARSAASSVTTTGTSIAASASVTTATSATAGAGGFVGVAVAVVVEAVRADFAARVGRFGGDVADQTVAGWVADPYAGVGADAHTDVAARVELRIARAVVRSWPAPVRVAGQTGARGVAAQVTGFPPHRAGVSVVRIRRAVVGARSPAAIAVGEALADEAGSRGGADLDAGIAVRGGAGVEQVGIVVTVVRTGAAAFAACAGALADETGSRGGTDLDARVAVVGETGAEELRIRVAVVARARSAPIRVAEEARAVPVAAPVSGAAVDGRAGIPVVGVLSAVVGTGRSPAVASSSPIAAIWLAGEAATVGGADPMSGSTVAGGAGAVEVRVLVAVVARRLAASSRVRAFGVARDQAGLGGPRVVAAEEECHGREDQADEDVFLSHVHDLSSPCPSGFLDPMDRVRSHVPQ